MKDDLMQRIAAVEADLDRERLRLAVCGVVNPECWGASSAISRVVDREMRYRSALLQIRAGMVEAPNSNIIDYIDSVLEIND